jgi:pimeloyl-ACP methyl ester carboxylesterase
MTPDQIVAFVLALTAPTPDAPLFPVIASGGADARYPVTAAACPRPLAPFEIEGTTVACGKVNVPEDHANPDGRRIDLTVMVFKSRSLAPAPDAVVHLHGGPGGGIINEVSQTSRFFEHLRTRRDVVAFDQRGVDASGSAESRCFATMAADPQAIVDATRGLGDRQALTREMTRACLDEIRASGADISKINTEQNAMDVSAVMHALGYPTYNIYGISYGTKLGQEVMRTAPEGVRSVVLDSVAPVSAAIYDTLALPYAEAIQHVFDYCTADPKCAAAYPDLRNRFWAVQARLETDPIETPEGTIGTQSLIDLFDDKNNWRNQMQGSSGYIPKMVAELEAGDPTTFLAMKANRLPLHPTPESVLAGLTGLDAVSRGFAEAALRLAQMGKINDLAVVSALERLEAEQSAAARSLGLVETFEAELATAAQALPTKPARAAFAADYLALRTGDETRDSLVRMLSAHFAEESGDRLAALLGMMTDAQLAEVFARVSTDNVKVDQFLLENFESEMFACQEDMDINSPEGTAAVSATLRSEYGWPESMTSAIEDFLNTAFFPMCEEFERHPRPGFHDPVMAAIPTLVLQGSMDVQTAPSWGALTVSTLPKGQLAFFPETGHGALAFSQCARDIGAAFLENPEATVDTSCTAALLPSFVLPDGTMSR